LIRPLALTALVLASTLSHAQDGAYREAARAVDHREYRVGELLPDVAFETIDGTSHSLSAYAGGTPLVIAIRDVNCPLCKRYGPRLAAIEKEYEGTIRFLYINASEIDSIDEMRAEVRDYGLQGAYVKDAGGSFARLLRAERTTDVFLLDRARTLRYRGAVDDQYGIGYQNAEPAHTYLKDAIEAVLADQPVAVRATSAPGCVLSFENGGSDAEERVDAITYHSRISRIIQSNCQSCHRDGGPAPFALETYEQAKARRSTIAFAIEAGVMPPWHADAENSHAFENDRSLSDRDRAALLAWIENGVPEGDPKDAAAPIRWTSEWQIGEPDAIVEINETYRVPAEGAVDYKYTWVKTDFAEDKWITAMEIRPTHPEVVHHVLVFIEEPPQEGEPRESVRRRWQGGVQGYFAGLVPGQATTVYPEGMAKRLPAGAWLKFQIHYTPNGEACEDRTQIGFVFADDPPAREMHTASAATTRFRIPAGADNHELIAWEQTREPITLYSFAPHMHLRGKAFRYEVFYPDNSSETILDIPRYDFNWQTRYKLREPVRLPAGTRIKATAWYDNSANNPANPDPTRNVSFGEQTWDEMMIGYFEYWREGE